jgi:hypothetical protein
MELFTALLAGFFLWVFLYHWHHSALSRMREAAGELLIEVPAASRVVRTPGWQKVVAGAAMVVPILLILLVRLRNPLHYSSPSDDILPGLCVWVGLSFGIPPYRRDAPLELRAHGVVRRKQSYENRPGRLVFTPWSEIAGCKWYDKLPTRYVHTQFLLLERSIPTGDIDAVTVVAGRFVPVYDRDGRLIGGAEPKEDAQRVAPRGSTHRLGLQFSLQSLLLLMVVASCVFSCYGIRYRRLQPQRAALTRLQTFNPQIRRFGDNVWDVDFSNCKDKPTDDDLACLAPLVELEMLELSGAPVTDAGLKHLAGLKNLHCVDLSGTQVTPAGVAALRRALPKTSILGPTAGPGVPAAPASGKTGKKGG